MNWYDTYKTAAGELQPAEIRYYSEDDPESDWQHAEQADAAFQASNIRPERGKQLSHVALVGDQAVGGVYGGWSKGEEAPDGKEVMVYSFDVAVHPEHRNQMTGLKLIEEAIRHYDSEKSMYQEMGSHTMMRCHVVNPKLYPILERRYGFEIESEYGGGQGAFVVRY